MKTKKRRKLEDAAILREGYFFPKKKKGNEATEAAILEAVQYYANRISKSVNGSPMTDLPFILFALEQVYQGFRAASDPEAVKAADGLRELFSCISYDPRNL